MSHTVTLRLSDKAYAAVKHYAAAEHTSMNSWVEEVLDAEDMRRRCAAHGAWMASNPQVATAALDFYQENQRSLRALGLPNLSAEGR